MFIAIKQTFITILKYYIWKNCCFIARLFQCTDTSDWELKNIPGFKRVTSVDELLKMPTIYCSLCQEQLPDTGVPITRHRFDHMREKFDDYVKNRTLQNWKFWIVSFSLKLFSPPYWFYSVATWHMNQPSVSGYPFCPLHYMI